MRLVHICMVVLSRLRASSARLKAHVHGSHVPLSCLVCLCLQGLQPAAAARLSQFSFQSDVRLSVSAAVPYDGEADALRAALGQCSDLNTTGRVYLAQWDWTEELVQVAAEGLSRLQDLSFARTCDGDLTEAYLEVALQLRLSCVCASDVELESDAHEDAVWAFDLELDTLSLEELAKMPLSSEGANMPTVTCGVVVIDPMEQTVSGSFCCWLA